MVLQEIPVKQLPQPKIWVGVFAGSSVVVVVVAVVIAVNGNSICVKNGGKWSVEIVWLLQEKHTKAFITLKNAEDRFVAAVVVVVVEGVAVVVVAVVVEVVVVVAVEYYL